MKGFAISVLLSVAAVVAFFVGLATGITPVVFVVFCAWTPLMLITGFTAARSGIRLVVSADDYEALPNRSVRSNGLQRRRAVQRLEEM